MQQQQFQSLVPQIKCIVQMPVFKLLVDKQELVYGSFEDLFKINKLIKETQEFTKEAMLHIRDKAAQNFASEINKFAEEVEDFFGRLNEFLKEFESVLVEISNSIDKTKRLLEEIDRKHVEKTKNFLEKAKKDSEILREYKSIFLDFEKISENIDKNYIIKHAKVNEDVEKAKKHLEEKRDKFIEKSKKRFSEESNKFFEEAKKLDQRIKSFAEESKKFAREAKVKWRQLQEFLINFNFELGEKDVLLDVLAENGYASIESFFFHLLDQLSLGRKELKSSLELSTLMMIVEKIILKYDDFNFCCTIYPYHLETQQHHIHPFLQNYNNTGMIPCTAIAILAKHGYFKLLESVLDSRKCNPHSGELESYVIALYFSAQNNTNSNTLTQKLMDSLIKAKASIIHPNLHVPTILYYFISKCDTNFESRRKEKGGFDIIENVNGALDAIETVLPEEKEAHALIATAVNYLDFGEFERLKVIRYMFGMISLLESIEREIDAQQFFLAEKMIDCLTQPSEKEKCQEYMVKKLDFIATFWTPPILFPGPKKAIKNRDELKKCSK